jgi:hypothetical protein
MTTTTVEIRRLAEWDALHRHYQGQTEPQGCYIELDCQTGLLTATYNAEIGNAIPFSVYHGHDRRYHIPCITADAANELMEEIRPLAERVIAGYTSEWDGSNHRARFTTDAEQAEEEIERIIEGVDVETCGISDADASEWLTETDPAITAQTTDEEIATLAEQAEKDAAYERIVLIDADGYLTRLRDEMRADAED